MRQSEQSGGDDQRGPAAAELLDPAEEHSAEQHLLRDRGEYCGTEERTGQAAQVALTGDPICADDRRHGHDSCE